jgi:hypothetical protein
MRSLGGPCMHNICTDEEAIMDWLGEIVAFSSCGTARRAAVFGMKDNEDHDGNTPASRGKS